MSGRRRAYLLLAAFAACSYGPSLADDEVFAHPAGSSARAKAGEWITWRCEGGDVTEETHACVDSGENGVAIEERETRDGVTTVTSLRYAPDGELIAAWRGVAGGDATPLRLVPPPTLDDYRAMANDAGAPIGVSLDDARATQVHTEEVVDTPAGRFACRVHRTETAMLFMTATIASWHSREPLPLSRKVQFEMGDSVTGLWQRQVLAAYGWTGAVPLLVVPQR